MKKLKLIVIVMALFCAGAVRAQVSVSVNVGAPPPWGPAGYTDVQYYYLPDVEAFYDVPSAMFIYDIGGVWVHRAYLPGRFRNYDLYGGYKVVMNDYRGSTPYVHFKEYRTKYAKGYRGQVQKNIGERPGKGNSVAKKPGNANPKNKVGPGNNKSAGPGHDKNMKADHGHDGGGGEGKKK